MGRLNSKRKGSAYENEILDKLAELNPAAAKGRRNWQFFGNNKGNADIQIPGLDDLHPECKRTEKFSFKKYILQVMADCAGRVPVIIHRFSRMQDWVCLPLSDCTRAAVNWLQWLGWTVTPPEEKT